MADVVLLEFCGEPLALTRDQLEEARCRARELLPATESSQAGPAERMVDAARLAELVGVPASWLEEQARRGRLPSLQLGKYRRFHVAEAIAALRKIGRTA
jgi:hypothetical protein